MPNGQRITISGSQFPLNVWTHFVLSFHEPTAAGLKTYENGNPHGSTPTVNSVPRMAGNGKVIVGSYYSYPHLVSTLEMDELIFFNRALIQDEIVMLYDQHA